MSSAKTKHDISHALSLRNAFPSKFRSAAEVSAERGALEAIAFTVELQKLGVPLEEAFQNACSAMGYDGFTAPEVVHFSYGTLEKPPENADDVTKAAYRVKTIEKALSVAASVLTPRR